MKTISSVVEQYIKSKPFLLSSLSQGIINLTSLARIMMPELESHLGKDVKQGAVVMSLKRLSEELDFKINYKISKVLKNIGEITVRSSLTDFTYITSDTLLDNQAKLISEINKQQDIFYTSSRGVNETNIVISASVEQLIVDALSDYNFPIAFNMPAGHEKDNRAMIFGRTVQLKVDKNQSTIVFEK